VYAWTVLSLVVLALPFRAEIEGAPLAVVPICLLAGLYAGGFWPEFRGFLRDRLVLALAGAFIFLVALAGFVLNHYTNAVRPALAAARAPGLPPGLAWHLRDFETVRVETPSTSAARILISSTPLPNVAERPRTSLLTTPELAPPVNQTGFARLWRWATLRE